MGSLAILSEFIEQAMLSIEPTMFNVKQGQADAVNLMTIHAAKGLEFDTVICLEGRMSKPVIIE